MPNPGADRPLRKVTLNLYEEDCVKMEQLYGYGWSTIVRTYVHEVVNALNKSRKQTVGDFDDD